ncbi:unnamed protein product, partial [Amoebophrya sp. A25]
DQEPLISHFVIGSTAKGAEENNGTTGVSFSADDRDVLQFLREDFQYARRLQAERLASGDNRGGGKRSTEEPLPIDTLWNSDIEQKYKGQLNALTRLSSSSSSSSTAPDAGAAEAAGGGTDAAAGGVPANSTTSGPSSSLRRDLARTYRKAHCVMKNV